MSNFKTTEEIFKYLVEGGTIVVTLDFLDEDIKRRVKLIDGSLHTRTKSGTWVKGDWLFDKPQMWSKYIEHKWYEDIPKGSNC